MIFFSESDGSDGGGEIAGMKTGFGAGMKIGFAAGALMAGEKTGFCAWGFGKERTTPSGDFIGPGVRTNEAVDFAGAPAMSFSPAEADGLCDGLSQPVSENFGFCADAAGVADDFGSAPTGFGSREFAVGWTSAGREGEAA